MWWFAVYNEYDQGIYSRNVASLSGEVLADTSDLAASGNPGIGYEELNLRDRSILFAPDRFSSPERTLPKTISISTLVYLHLQPTEALETRWNTLLTKFSTLEHQVSLLP